MSTSADSSGSDAEVPRCKRRRGDLASEEAARLPGVVAELQRGWVHGQGSLIQQYDVSAGAAELQAGALSLSLPLCLPVCRCLSLSGLHVVKQSQPIPFGGSWGWRARMASAPCIAATRRTGRPTLPRCLARSTLLANARKSCRPKGTRAYRTPRLPSRLLRSRLRSLGLFVLAGILSGV